MLIQGDCLIELPKLEKKSIDLIYLDPPFFTQRTHTLKSKDSLKEYSFDDSRDNIIDYKNYIKERLEKCRNVLKDTGSIFLHCDRSASHYLRIALDEVFGTNNFQSEIIWYYRRWSNSKKGLLNSHQVIFFYSKTKDFKFNSTYTDYSPTTNIDQIFQKRVKDENGKTTYKIKNGEIELIGDKKGVPLSDVWEIPYLNPKAKERVGYPTQKPILLLDKIIELVTNEGDTVLDPFCGSGTTLVASKILNRNFIGIDQSEEAILLAEQRLLNPMKTESALLKNGKDSYKNKDFKLLEILNNLNIIPVQRNKGIDGFLRTERILKPIPVRIQKESETLEKTIQLLLQACQKNKYQTKILIKTNNLQTNQLFDLKSNDLDNSIIIFDSIKKFLKDKEKILNL